ncbi:MAG TPA: penicillin acylase family protein, partial [Candidatus Binatia bacterium]|nr:penicillin acylase family protein [Candidatus Binatia bacterium]
LSHFFEPPHRFRRIHQLLGARKKFSVDELAAIQLDTVSLHAKELIATLAADFTRLSDNDPTLQWAVDRLRGWDGQCNASSVEATIFHVFHHRLLNNLLVPTLGEELFSAYVEILNQCIVPTDRILGDVHSPWFATRSRYELVALSLREACADLGETLGENAAGWEWRRIHQLEMNHPFGRFNFLKPLVNVGPLMTPGDGTTINLGFYRHSNPYLQTVGPSLRFIVETGNWEHSGFILASGQSGHPLSVHYADQTPLWSSGKRTSLYREPEATGPYHEGLLFKPG